MTWEKNLKIHPFMTKPVKNIILGGKTSLSEITRLANAVWKK